jgi:hypothetical protein
MSIFPVRYGTAEKPATLRMDIHMLHGDLVASLFLDSLNAMACSSSQYCHAPVLRLPNICWMRRSPGPLLDQLR